MAPKEASVSEPTTAEECSGLSLGFLGCGTIAASIATSIATQTRIKIDRISVSRRSRQKSEALVKAFPHLISVHDDNQEVVDRSDIIFVCVLPKQANSVVRDLEFRRPHQKLVSIVATASLEDLSEHSGVSLSNIAKMICTPSIAQHEGACLVYPRQDNILPELFNAMGGCVQCNTNEEMTTLMSSTCVMGPVYGILKTHRDWMVSRGIDKKDATFVVGKQYQAIVKDVERQCSEPGRLEELIEEQTPGGINKEALENLDMLGGLDAYASVMDSIANRIDGTSVGGSK